MIVGVGTDLVALDAFRAQLGVPGTAFVEGTFTEGEVREARSRPDGDVGRHLAARFAAKEAFVKAWDGSNFGLPPVKHRADLREIEVVCDAWGRPSIRTHGHVAQVTVGLLAHVSLTHDGDLASAVVVLER